MEGVGLRIRTPQRRLAICMHGADNMVVGDDLVITEAFGGLDPVANRRWVVADFVGGEDRSELACTRS